MLGRRPRPGRTRALPAAVALVTSAWLATGALAMAPTASAHPLGAPQTVRISSSGQHVAMQWAAPPDDLTALALHIGAIGGSRTFVYDRGVLVPEESDPSTAALLADSPRLPEYLLNHVKVSQSGDACPGAVTRTQDLAGAGVRLRFDCPATVSQVRVAVTMLTDLHPAYRTAAVTDSGQRAMYTRDSSVHGWQLGTSSADATTLSTLGRLLAPVGSALAAVVLTILVVRRRRTRSGR